jgi:antitoxin component YwqK of YwqJK toxin-antitoxin module
MSIEPFEVTREDGCKFVGERNRITKALNGKYAAYYANGQLWFTTTYTNGLRNGPYCEYYEDGQLERDCDYKDGEIHGPYKQYYEDGGLCVDTTYAHGERNGSYKEYYRCGTLGYWYIYDNGIKINNALEFEQDGSRRAITHFSATGAIRKRTTYYKSGNELTIHCYDDNENLIEFVEYYNIKNSKRCEQQYKDGKCVYSANWTTSGDLIA